VEVLSGIPQRLILGPLLFIIFINDLVEIGEENIKLFLFADDAKIYCHVKNLTYKFKDKLQRGIENSVDWTNRWQVSLNINKCKIMSVHHRKYVNMGLVPNYDINNILLEEVKEIGVCNRFRCLF